MNGSVETGPSCQRSRAGGARAGKYVTFRHRGVLYGVESLKAREIMGVRPLVTPPAAERPTVPGEIHVHGRTLRLLDLPVKADNAGREGRTPDWVIVLGPGTTTPGNTAGIAADQVSDVLEIRPSHMRSMRDASPGVDAGILQGTARVRHEVIHLLDVDKLLGRQQAETGGGGPGAYHA